MCTGPPEGIDRSQEWPSGAIAHLRQDAPAPRTLQYVALGFDVAFQEIFATLAAGGTLIAPVGGSGGQSLIKLRKDADGNIERTDLAPVVFVPLLSGMVD